MIKLIINMKGKWIISLHLHGEFITDEAKMDKKHIFEQLTGEVATQELVLPADSARTMYESLRTKMISQFGIK